MKNKETTSDYDVIVIGSGAGGLTSGVALAKHGKKVLVLEQHYVPGGWCHSFQLNGQKFSPGVHYLGGLGEGQNLRRLYEGLGVSKDLVFFKMAREGFEHAIVGDTRFDYIDNFEEYTEALVAAYPEEEKGIRKFLAIVENVEGQLQRLAKESKLKDKLQAVFSKTDLLRFGWRSVQKVLDKYIKSEELKTILSIQCGDMGSTPDRANFAFFAGVKGHYANGGYYPMGGGGAIVKAMTKALKANGGDIRVKALVDRILIENGKVAGVRLATGEEFTASTVISNADAHVTYGKMIEKKYQPKSISRKLDKTTYSPSSILMFITVDMDVTQEGIDSGNYWISSTPDQRGLMECNSRQELTSGDKFDGVFIGCSTLKDPTSFNGRYHNFEIITFVDNHIFDVFDDPDFDIDRSLYKDMKKKVADKLLNNLEDLIPGVKDRVVQMELGTPKTNKFYINATKGNAYGLEKTLKQIGPGGYQLKTKIDGLYMCGASTLSHGVAGASDTGLQVAAQVLGRSVTEVLENENITPIRVYDAEDKSTWPLDLIEKINTKQRRFREIEVEAMVEYEDPKRAYHVAS